MVDKKELRARMRTILKEGIDVDTLPIWQKIESTEEFRKAKTILLYWSMSGEVNTVEVIGKWSETKQVCLPKVDGDKLTVKKYEKDNVCSGYRGIQEPAEVCVTVEPEIIDLAIIPGLAFDRDCNRLGRGKGFYDRLLPKLKCPKIGIAFNCQIVEYVPADSWDIPLDMVVTPDMQIQKNNTVELI